MELFHRIYGEGKPMVILHGLFGFSDNWQSQAKIFSAYFQVITVDLRNHGHSPWSDEFSYELMAEDVNDLLLQLNIEKCILIGHSMGGKVAIHFAQKFETKIEKLIVVDMGIKKYPPHHQHILEALHSLPLDELKTRNEAAAILREKLQNEGVVQFLLKNLYWQDKKLTWRMNLPLLELKMDEILAAAPAVPVHLPSLFIRGGLSNYILDEDWENIENLFSDAELITIPDAGHWVHAEKLDDFTENVLKFCLFH